MPTFGSPPDPRAPAAEAFRAAFNTALTAIEPFAVLSQSRHFQASIPELALDPLKAVHDTDNEATLFAPPDEAADFAGLAAALNEFATAFSRIVMPDKAQRNAERVRLTTLALAEIAAQHGNRSDQREPSQDKDAAKEFYKAVNAWEDATADMANKLGL